MRKRPGIQIGPEYRWRLERKIKEEQEGMRGEKPESAGECKSLRECIYFVKDQFE